MADLTVSAAVDTFMGGADQAALRTALGLGGAATAAAGFNYVGSSVPSSPTTGQTWLELSGSVPVNSGWFWDGSRWLSLELNTQNAVLGGTQFDTPGINTNRIWMPVPQTKIWLVSLVTAYTAASATLNGSNFWTITYGELRSNGITYNAGGSAFSPVVVINSNTNSGASAVDLDHITTTINEPLSRIGASTSNRTAGLAILSAVSTGSPPAITTHSSVRWRYAR